MRLKNLFRKREAHSRADLLIRSSISMMFQMSGRIAGLLLVFVIAKFMSVADYGGFVYARNAILLIGPIAVLGFNLSVTRIVPTYVARGEFGLARGFMNYALAVTALSATIAVALIFAALMLLPELVEPSLRHALIIGLVGVVPYAALMVTTETARALGFPSIADGPPNLGQSVAVFVLVMGIYLALGTVTADGAIIALVISCFAMVAAQAIMIRRATAATLGAATPAYEGRNWLVTSAPLSLSTAAFALSDRGVFFLLGSYAAAAEVGIFGFLLLISQTVAIIPLSISGMAAARQSAAIAVGEHARARTILRDARLAGCALTVLGSLGAAFASQELLPLLLPHLAVPLDTLAIVLASVTITAWTRPAGYFVLSYNRSVTVIFNQTAAAATAVGVTFLLVPSMGLNGAAIAMLAGCISRLLVLEYVINWKIFRHLS
ncbi:MAG TPA: hypothetical protein VLA00_03830 [Xanthobacteraceae bacterium]|nr:hypothetical protein [Xanthobacteraceae bacterium]